MADQSASAEAGPSSLPSSADIERALGHLNNLAGLLDSRPAAAAQPLATQSLAPGLVESLPHLLSPLSQLRAYQLQRERERMLLASTQGAAAEAVQSPSPSLDNFRRMAYQVDSVITSIIGGLSDTSSIGAGAAVQLAQAVLAEQRGTGDRRWTQEERKRIMMMKRMRRRIQHEVMMASKFPKRPRPITTSNQEQTERNLPEQLTFTFQPTHAEIEEEGLSEEASLKDTLAHRIARRIWSTRNYVRSLDLQDAATAAPNFKAWLVQLTIDEKERSPLQDGDSRLAHFLVCVTLPGVAKVALWFDIMGKDKSDWRTVLRQVNLRSPAECGVDRSDANKSISKLHLSSSNAVLREMSLHVLRHHASSQPSAPTSDPLQTLSRALLHVFALRSLFSPPPPTRERLEEEEGQRQQMALMVGVEPPPATTGKGARRCILAGWLDPKEEADGAGSSFGIRWAWCENQIVDRRTNQEEHTEMVEEQPSAERVDTGQGQWKAYLNPPIDLPS